MKLFKAYVAALRDLGLDVDKSRLWKAYNSLDPLVKENANIILLPAAVSPGVVYAMDNRTGQPVPFDFRRTSAATYFDKDFNLVEVPADMPRIDWGNYGSKGKLLVEGQTTNLQINSGNFQNLDQYDNGYNTSNQLKLVTGSPNYIHAQGDNSDSRFWINTYNKADFKAGDKVSLSLLYYSEKLIERAHNKYFPVENGNEFWNDTTSGKNIHLIKKYLFQSNKEFITLPNGQDVYNLLFSFYFGKQNMDIYNIQTEKNGVATSYIPTYDTQATRSADLLAYNLPNNCSIYLHTTDGETIVDRQKGFWNIHNEIVNGGIYSFAIYDKVLSDEEKVKILGRLPYKEVRIKLDNTSGTPSLSGNIALFQLSRTTPYGIQFKTLNGTKLYNAASFTDNDPTDKTPLEGIVQSGDYLLMELPDNTIDVVTFTLQDGDYISTISNNGMKREMNTELLDIRLFPSMKKNAHLLHNTFPRTPYYLYWDDVIRENIIVAQFNMAGYNTFFGEFTDRHAELVDASLGWAFYFQAQLGEGCVLDIGKLPMKTGYFDISKNPDAENVFLTCTKEPEYLMQTNNNVLFSITGGLSLTPEENDRIIIACSKKSNLSSSSFYNSLIRLTGGRTSASDEAFQKLTDAGITVKMF